MTNEIHHWVQQLSLLGIFPENYLPAAEIINETQKGHVTIVPTPRIYDYAFMFSEVAPDDFDYCLNHTYV